MKKTTRFKIWWTKTFKKMTPIRKKEIMEYQIDEYNKAIDRLNDEHSNTVSRLQYSTKILDEIISMSKDIKNIFDSENSSDTLREEAEMRLHELQGLYNVEKESIKNFEYMAEKIIKIIDKLNKEKQKLIKQKNVVEIQQNFIDAVDTLNSIKIDSSELNLGELVKDSEIEFNATLINLDKLDNVSELTDELSRREKTLSDEFLSAIE